MEENLLRTNWENSIFPAEFLWFCEYLSRTISKKFIQIFKLLLLFFEFLQQISWLIVYFHHEALNPFLVSKSFCSPPPFPLFMVHIDTLAFLWSEPFSSLPSTRSVPLSSVEMTMLTQLLRRRRKKKPLSVWCTSFLNFHSFPFLVISVFNY